MIDIHHHLLFGLDDGPSDIEISVAMAQMSIENGVTHIVCTPHSSQRYQFQPDLNRERLAMLNQRLGGMIMLGLGCDFHLMYENIEDAIASPEKYSINGLGYLLVEFPDQNIAANTSDTFFRLSLAGMTPIITHPERNPVLARQPERMAEWLRAGCYIQVTAASLTGRFGRLAQQVAHELLRRNWVHFIATDAHDITSRPPQLHEAFEIVSEQYSKETAERLFIENPRCAFEGITMPDQPEMHDLYPEQVKSGFFSKIFGR